ncbi:MAG: hypothetical protein JST67_11580 [Bacteroidetes bacterium]|nr:hypothetical protein [Bacteroidota bacterium]
MLYSIKKNKRKIIWIASVFFFVNSWAQTKKQEGVFWRLSAGFSVGQGIPCQQYGSASTQNIPISRLNGTDTNQISGYAQKGFHYSFWLSYQITKRWGVLAALYGGINELDINALNERYTAYFPPGKSSIYTDQDYRMEEFVIGPQYTLPVSKHLDFNFKACGGYVLNGYVPRMIYYGPKDTAIYAFTTGKGWCYNVGLGIKYKLEPMELIGIAFHFNIGYSGGLVSYPYYVVVRTDNITPQYIYAKKTMSMGVFQMSVGASIDFIRFKRKPQTTP